MGEESRMKDVIRIFMTEDGAGFRIEPEVYKDKKTTELVKRYLKKIGEEIELRCSKD